MALKLAYFQPVVIAVDQIPPVEFSKVYNLAEQLHAHPELNDATNPLVSIRGGQQIQVYPNKLDLDVKWLVTWLESICQGYMEVITAQSGTKDLDMCKPVITSIWTIKQGPGDYQEMHSHPGGSLSGNIYLNAPDFDLDSGTSDGQISFRLPHTRDVNKFVMSDHWNYAPTAGTMLVFPSYLPHTVYPWRGDGYRTVMAFDARLLPKDEVVRELING
jgi:hypothetical protein